MSVIALHNVAKSYKGVTLFNNVNVTFEAGKIHGIIGHNGSGKSVLFKIICGFVRPDAGTVWIDPQYRSAGGGFPRDFGVIIDRPGYLANRTGYQNLTELASIRAAIDAEKIRATMEQFGLSPELTQKVRNYSLGMKQKLALAQAVMEDQQVLILDEPFNALDPDSVDTVRRTLGHYRDEGRTIIFTSHNREDMEVLCDHTYQLRREQLEQIT